MLGLLLGLTAATTTVNAHIVSVSMFKNGYAVVLRDFDIPGPGQYDLTSSPQAALGTLWFAVSEGTTIDAIRTMTATSNYTANVSSNDQILQANLGREVTLGLGLGDAVTGRSVTGKLLSQGENVILKTAAGTMVVPKTIITSISASGDLTYTTTEVATHKALEFQTSGKPGHVSMISLERGLTWVPAYAVDISDKDKLSLIAKATVVNDLDDLKSVEARFVTGFPNVPFAGTTEPLVSGLTLDGLVRQLSSARAPGGQGGGGLGGQMSGAVPDGIDFVSYDPTDNSLITQGAEQSINANGGMRPSRLAGQQLEDLFFYRQPDVTLQKGERAYYALFRAGAAYKEVYTWDVADPVTNNFDYRNTAENPPQEDVWHTLEFKNTSGQPLTTAVATTMQKGQILGQAVMTYVSAGGNAELKITKAMDVRAESSEEEVSRERGAVRFINNAPQFDLVTLKGTLQVTNLKTEPVTMRIRHSFTGDLISADGDAIVKKTTRGLRDTNPTGLLTWNKKLEKGEKLNLTYTYKLYVHSQ